MDAEKKLISAVDLANVSTVSSVKSPSWSWMLARGRPGTRARAACCGPASWVRYGTIVGGMEKSGDALSSEVGMWSRERESRFGVLYRNLTTFASKGSEHVNWRRRG